MRIIRQKAALIFITLAALCSTATSQTTIWEPWNEKWPVDVAITPENAAVTYLRANFGKLGEYAAKKLEKLLSDPAAQAKIGAKALDILIKLSQTPAVSEDEKARRFIAAIEADIASFVSAPASPMNLRIGFSGSYDVMRLNWDRRTQRLTCQRSSCYCPGSSSNVLPGTYCQWYESHGGQNYYYSQPVACTFYNDTLDIESRYQVYRNNQLLATFGEVRNVASGTSFPTQNFSFGFISGSINVTLPPGSADAPGIAGPFYDYDPYNRVVGEPLTYRVTASSSGCGNGYNNYLVGHQNVDSGNVSVDANGDGRPDFYPADVLAEKRNVGPFVGTKVAEHLDASGRVSVAVFERQALVATSQAYDFAVTVPLDYVVVGGGGEGLEGAQGNMLTASYPSDDMTTWHMTTTDHLRVDPVRAKVWEVGVKIAGLTRDQLRQNVTLQSITVPSQAIPNGAAFVPAEYALVGGGFKSNWVDWGNLGVASYPDTAQSWRASSKDHVQSSPASLQVYAIGIRRNIVGIGNILTDVRTARTGYAAHPAGVVPVAAGFALAGCGARVNWSGWGNLFWKIKPNGQDAQRSCEAASKDHLYSSPATLDIYSIGLRLN